MIEELPEQNPQPPELSTLGGIHTNVYAQLAGLNYKQEALELAITLMASIAQIPDTDHTNAFESLSAIRKAIKDFDSKSETITKSIDSILVPALKANALKGVLWVQNGIKYLVEWRKGQAGRKTIDKVLLLNNGVTPEQIDLSTKVGKPSSDSLMVRRLAAANDSFTDEDFQ